MAFHRKSNINPYQQQQSQQSQSQQSQSQSQSNSTAAVNSTAAAAAATNAYAARTNLTRQFTGGLSQLYSRIAKEPINKNNKNSKQFQQQQQQQQQQPIKQQQQQQQQQQSQSISTSTSTYPHTRSDGFLNYPNNNNNNNNYSNNSTNSSQFPLLNNRYELLDCLGEGTFSQLYSAIDHYIDNRRVALKIMNNKYSFIGLQELEKLCTLNTAATTNNNSNNSTNNNNSNNQQDNRNNIHIVKLLGAFYFDTHLVLVLEVLGDSLLKLLSQQPQYKLSIDSIRKIAFQLITALQFLKKKSIIHGDIKPENVLKTSNNHNSNNPDSYNVKLIDFGNSMSLTESTLYYDEFDVQTLYYRAPEILLGLQFNNSIDIWSLGCLLMELATGKPLFQCNSNKELFTLMIQLLGPLPEQPFKAGKFAQLYFNNNNNSNNNIDNNYNNTNPATLNQLTYNNSNTSNNSGSNSQYYMYRLNNLAKVCGSRDRDFISFIAELLEYDPAQRITPIKALFHPFFAKLIPLQLLLGEQFNIQQQQQQQQPPMQPQQQQQQQSQQQQQRIQSNLIKSESSFNKHQSINNYSQPLQLQSQSQSQSPSPSLSQSQSQQQLNNNNNSLYNTNIYQQQQQQQQQQTVNPVLVNQSPINSNLKVSNSHIADQLQQLTAFTNKTAAKTPATAATQQKLITNVSQSSSVSIARPVGVSFTSPESQSKSINSNNTTNSTTNKNRPTATMPNRFPASNLTAATASLNQQQQQQQQQLPLPLKSQSQSRKRSLTDYQSEIEIPSDSDSSEAQFPEYSVIKSQSIDSINTTVIADSPTSAEAKSNTSSSLSSLGLNRMNLSKSSLSLSLSQSQPQSQLQSPNQSQSQSNSRSISQLHSKAQISPTTTISSSSSSSSSNSRIFTPNHQGINNQKQSPASANTIPLFDSSNKRIRTGINSNSSSSLSSLGQSPSSIASLSGGYVSQLAATNPYFTTVKQTIPPLSQSISQSKFPTSVLGKLSATATSTAPIIAPLTKPQLISSRNSL